MTPRSNIYVVIPARYASTRLPGKPLLDVSGKPLIQRVYDCARASGIADIVIATDDERIRSAAEGFGARTCMTDPAHQSGTERIAEVIRKMRIPADACVVNLQGDEPLMPPDLIHETAQTLLRAPDAAAATACCRIMDDAAYANPNVVKVVTDAEGYALYFSRAPIPYHRDSRALPPAWQHIGIYAYRAQFVEEYCRLQPCELEQIERLEQLRILHYGRRIYAHKTKYAPGRGVDTPEDLEYVRKIYAAQK